MTAERRPHAWACRHCDMVDDYRLAREADVQAAEGVHRQDEDFHAVTFKQWLQVFEWDHPDQHTTTDSDEQDPADHGGDGQPWPGWEHTRSRATGDEVDPVARARAAVLALPMQRVTELEHDEDAEQNRARRRTDNHHHETTDSHWHDDTLEDSST